ncbi:MAG TPA: hypothetical protein VNS88_11840, partial [Nitrospiraceae bacterium]|nr:hypothetical protein [Nitrospiraceae bacterium]
ITTWGRDYGRWSIVLLTSPHLDATLLGLLCLGESQCDNAIAHLSWKTLTGGNAPIAAVVVPSQSLERRCVGRVFLDEVSRRCFSSGVGGEYRSPTENDVTEKFWALLVTKNGDRQSVSGVEEGIF